MGVLHNTVITDKLDLKGFKVIARLKEGEVLRMLDLPKRPESVESDSKMARIFGRYTKPDGTSIEGYVTIQSTLGQVQLDPIENKENVEEEEEEEEVIVPYTQEEREPILEEMRENAEKELQEKRDALVEALEIFDSKMLELQVHHDSSQEDDDTIATVVEALEEANVDAQEKC